MNKIYIGLFIVSIAIVYNKFTNSSPDFRRFFPACSAGREKVLLCKLLGKRHAAQPDSRVFVRIDVCLVQIAQQMPELGPHDCRNDEGLFLKKSIDSMWHIW